MSAIPYDEAVKAKIKALFNNTEFQSRELVFKTVTDRQSEVKFPLISIYRPDGWSIDLDSTNWNAMINNQPLENWGNAAGRIIRISLVYTIDIYANTREDLEALTSELVMYLLKNPKIVVTYKAADDSDSVSVSTNLTYMTGPERTSELDDVTVGRPYRYTLTYSLNNAVLFDFVNDSDPSSPDYVSKVTQIIFNVETNKDYLVSVGASGNPSIIVYNDKEEKYVRN